MKRHLLIIAGCLLLGAVVNVAVAWGCAAWIQVPPVDLGVIRLSDGKLWWVHKCDGPGVSRLFLSKGAEGWRDPQDYDAVVLPAWSRLVKEQSSGADPARNSLEDAHDIASKGKPLAADEEFRVADARGWPMLALWTETESQPGRSDWRIRGGVTTSLGVPTRFPSFNILPFRPLWPGFAHNTLFYATILWLLIPGPFALRRFLRARRGLCPKCAYPMGESSVCTECGIALPRRRPMPTF